MSLRSFTTLMATLGCGLGAMAQYLVVTPVGGFPVSHPVVMIRSITFRPDTMIMNRIDGATVVWPIDELVSYAFEAIPTGVVIHGEAAEVSIRPNPVRDRLTIVVPAHFGDQVVVDIVDMSGRLVVSLPAEERGPPGTRFSWDASAQSIASTGMFLCRITTPKGLFTKSFVIQP